MLGRLPLRHRLLILVVVVACSVGLGVWMAATPVVPIQLVPSLGAALALGGVAGFLLLHHSRTGVAPPAHRRLR